MPFTYYRTIYLSDTDAAGVIFFSQALAICHEAYEASLVASGVKLKEFFNHPSVAIPITHAAVDFFQPMFAGDRLLVELASQPLKDSEFEIAYQIVNDSSSRKLLGKAKTRHVCIHLDSRRRTPLPDYMRQWLSLT